MEFVEYKQMYWDFELSCIQSRMISLAASQTLKDFPKKLPNKEQVALSTTFKALGDALLLMAGEAEETEAPAVPPEPPPAPKPGKVEVPTKGTFSIPALQLFMFQTLAKGKQQPDFDTLLYRQELVMVLAHLEAFLADSLREMCRRDPRLLRRGKKMAWESILESGNWENLLHSMSQEYCYEFGWKSLREKIAHLRDEHGLSVPISAADLDFLDAAEQLRHITIHNGGRVTPEYLYRTKRTDMAVGEPIRLADDYVERLGSAARTTAGEVFVAIAVKFFAVPEAEVTGVWRGGKGRKPEEAGG